MHELIVDSFAGGGGASTGIELALGRSPDIAVNHDRIALAMHRANHPQTRHMLQDVATVDAVGMCQGRPIGMLWMSPDCTDHSKAKGAAPRRDGDKTTRGIGWAIYGWVKAMPKWQRPRVIFLENVEEYVDWGPLLPDGKRCPKRKGETFKAFVGAWRALGFNVEWRERRAWWSGSGTIRKRLYMVMRSDGEPIVWPEATHGNPNLPADALRIDAGDLKPWVTIAECIDWSLPVPSIFDTAPQIKAKLGLHAKRPLAPKTLARVAKGVERYVLKAAKPFVVSVAHGDSGGRRTYPLSEPGRTVVAGGNGDALATPYMAYAQQGGGLRSAEAPAQTFTASAKDQNVVVTSFVTKFRTGAVGHRADEPVHTITAHSSETHGGGAAPLGIVTPVFVGCGGRAGQSAPRPADAPALTQTAKVDLCVAAVSMMTMRNSGAPCSSPEQPGRTLVANGAGETVVATFLAQHNTGLIGHDVEKPISTIVNKGCTQQIVAAQMLSLRGSDRRDAPADEPGRTESAGGTHNAVVSLPLMTAYYGEGSVGGRADAPNRTETVKPRFGLAEATALAPPFTPEHEARAREVAEFLRAHGCWHGGEFVVIVIDGQDFVLVDIGMRMLTPRERYNANGFPRDYIIDHGVDSDGSAIRFTLEQQGHMCGNAVCPTEARALVAANFQPRDRARPGKPVEPLPLFLQAAE